MVNYTEIIFIFTVVHVVTSLKAPEWIDKSRFLPRKTPPYYFAMYNFTEYKEQDRPWYSPPFYTGPEGYKMRLVVYANGNGEGHSTHVSIYIQIIEKYDESLTWPFKGIIDFGIINWRSNDNHKLRRVEYREMDSVRGTMWGFHKFSSHNELYMYQYKTEYISTDIVYLYVSVSLTKH